MNSLTLIAGLFLLYEGTRDSFYGLLYGLDSFGLIALFLIAYYYFERT
ncbi:hypothetical protein HUU53_02320 [Candidatus Micrarchaeota archaeon]|nr:hypothetical protein [Candidatus Micrarchaeota archaeon]